MINCIGTRLDLHLARPERVFLGAFGEKLRQQREQRGISLDAISNTTKISTRMLRALEEEHFDQLPGGVFNKGFVRAYARHVGLDEEETLADYLAALRESQVQQQAIMPDLRASRRKPSGPTAHPPVTEKKLPALERASIDLQPRAALQADEARQSASPEVSSVQASLPSETDARENSSSDQTPSSEKASALVRWGSLVMALVLITAGLAFWNIRRYRAAAPGPNPIAAPSQSAPSAPVPGAPQSAEHQNSEASPQSAETSPRPPSKETSLQKNITEAKSEIQPASTGSGNTLPSTSETNPSESDKPSSASSGKSQPSSSGKSLNAAKSVGNRPTPPATFTLLIRAEKTTWISVVADGQLVAEETLIAPAQTSVRASRQIVVKAGNAAGAVFEMNGKRLGTPGADGEVKTYVFDANGIHPAEPASSPNP